LTHRSGLGLGAGDLMIWPDGSNFTATDIIQNLQYLKPVSGFHQNMIMTTFCILLQEVIHVVSGKAGVILSKSVLWNR
jgi:hypothetical protein